MRYVPWVLVAIFSVAALLAIRGMKTAPRSSAGTAEGRELIGQAAPEWGAKAWVHSGPLRLRDLRGKVVLVRWWTDGCSLCGRSAAALNEFHDRWSHRGLQVVGMYHPKPLPRKVSVAQVKQAAARLGFTFPIAVDDDWAALKRFWLNHPGRRFTSVSFVVDKKGVIRFIHPGGEYHEDGVGAHAQCRTDYDQLKRTIEELLAESYP